MRGLRYVFGACGAGLLLALTVSTVFAASDHAPSSGPAAKGAIASAGHRSANRARPRHGAKPAPHKPAAHKEQKQEIAGRPAINGPAGPADKSLGQHSLLGPFSLGVETDPNVKPRSIRGGEYDPERDGEPKGYRPPYLGLSLTAPLSW